MSSDLEFELHQFHEFLGQKLATGQQSLSPEEALDEWRLANRTAEELADDVAAVQEALDDMAQGDAGLPLEEFDREFRQRHGLPANS